MVFVLIIQSSFNMIKKILFILIAVALFGCEKWDLERDNPLDNNTDINSDKDPELVFSKYEVIYDNNDDGIINKGETVYLKVYIKNEGGSANNVNVKFSSNSTYVSSLSPSSLNYGDVTPNQEKVATYGYCYENYEQYTFKFTLSNSTPIGEQITFDLEMIDEIGNTWSDSFNVTNSSTSSTLNYSKYEVIFDNNDDGIINKGETVYLKLYVKNNGSSTANSLNVSFSSSSSYVSSLSPSSLNYGDVTANQEKVATYGYCYDNYEQYSFKFTLSNSTPVGQQITFNLQMTDESGNTWTDSFNITVIATSANLTYSKYEIIYEDNDNGIFNTGETAYIKLYVKNTGSSSANSISVSLSSSSSYISSISPSSLNYGDVTPNQEKIATYGYCYENYEQYSFKFNISNSTPTNHQANFSLSMVDESNNTWTDNFSITIY